eukprot:TRINITY_DN102837_c0_g1_i1.p1 TRINITY_DN102837_c0_g1~~TRINITY_DN102837_c0_g1_i1.p1  ORF type:complete len:1012 (-),score=228.75 TRINITY_DN102837_c0_g1_i1:163-3111(-)
MASSSSGSAGFNYMSFYASEAECQSISQEETNEFARVWIVCMTYGMGLSTMLCALYFGGGFNRRRATTWDIAESPSSSRSPSPIGDLEAEAEKPADTSKRSASKQSCFSQEVMDQTPNVAKAKKHLIKSSPTDQDGKFRGVWSTSLADISEIGGAGLELYFRLLLGMGFAFAFMSVATAPIVMFAWNGNFVPDTGSALAKTTIGNLGNIPQGLAPEGRLVIIGCQGVPIESLTAIFAKLDAVAVFIFLVFGVWFRFKTLARIRKEVDDNTTVADFGLEIEGLPAEIENQADYERLLTEHLLERMKQVREDDQRRGCCKRRKSLDLEPPSVKEIAFVRDYKKKLGSLKYLAELRRKRSVEEFKQNEKAVEKIDKSIEKVEQSLAMVARPEEELPVVRAYAIVGTMYDQLALINHYRFANWRMFRMCQSKARRFQEKPVRMNRPPEPSNILVENGDVPQYEVALRMGVIGLMWIIAVLVSSLGIFLMNYLAAQQQEGAENSQLGSAACDSGSHIKSAADATTYVCPFLNASVWTVEQASNFTGEVLDCYCATKGYMGVLDDARLSDPTEGGYCVDWLTKTGTGIAIGVLCSGVVVAINGGFKLGFIMFAEFERPLSVSVLEASKMTKVFLSQFISTGVIIYLINLHSSSIQIWPFGAGPYSDFERGWYTVVGGTIVTTLMINCVAAPAGGIAGPIIQKLMRCLTTHSVKTQDELLELYTNGPFDISANFAQLLMTIWVTMMYSAGMPIVNVFAAAYCFFSYWLHKWVLLKGSKQPPLYDCTLPQQAANIILLAVPLHIVFSILMYSHLCTFPSEPLGGSLADMSSAAAAQTAAAGTDVSGNGLFDRATRQSTWVHAMLLLFSLGLGAIYIVLSIVGATFGEFFKCFYQVLCSSSQARVSPANSLSQSPGEDIWDNVVATMAAVCPPTSYKLERHPDYIHIAKHMRPLSPVNAAAVAASVAAAAADEKPEPDAEAREDPLAVESA